MTGVWVHAEARRRGGVLCAEAQSTRKRSVSGQIAAQEAAVTKSSDAREALARGDAFLRLCATIMLALACNAITPAAQATPRETPAATAPTRHVTQTYLRATPGKRAALIAYIQANWFAMDHIGVQQGLFTSYALLERADDETADWDVIVAVGYPTAQGHDAPGVVEAFRKIRAAHREIKIEGQSLAELGTIVRHYPLTLVQQGS